MQNRYPRQVGGVAVHLVSGCAVGGVVASSLIVQRGPAIKPCQPAPAAALGRRWGAKAQSVGGKTNPAAVPPAPTFRAVSEIKAKAI
jgi:hypothetical protein